MSHKLMSHAAATPAGTFVRHRTVASARIHAPNPASAATISGAREPSGIGGRAELQPARPPDRLVVERRGVAQRPPAVDAGVTWVVEPIESQVGAKVPQPPGFSTRRGGASCALRWVRCGMWLGEEREEEGA